MPPYRFAVVVGALLMAGCSSTPDVYAPPAQRKPLAVSQPSFVGSFVTMSDPNADAYIVRDIARSVEAGTWRWTNRRPELQFYLPSVENRKFVMDFSIAGATFSETGPVTLAVFVNGQPLDKKRYEKPGQYLMELPVAPALLKVNALNTVAIEPDKVWVSKQDGVALGFILTSAGFRQ